MVSLWFPHFWGHLVIPAERRISGCHIFVVPNSHCVEKAMGFKESLDRRCSVMGPWLQRLPWDAAQLPRGPERQETSLTLQHFEAGLLIRTWSASDSRDAMFQICPNLSLGINGLKVS